MKAVNLFTLTVAISAVSVVDCSKCWKVIPEKGFYNNVKFPEVQITKMIPLTTARNLYSAQKPPSETIDAKRKISLPSTLQYLRFDCSANYRVSWGFESYPWITFNVWTGTELPAGKNGSRLYTATVEFNNVQETSLQTRIPICYSVEDPCIQTAVEPRSGTANNVEITFAAGSRYGIQSKSEKKDQHFGTNQNCTLKYGYDPESQKFYCEETDPTKPKNSGKIFLVPCADPVTCESFVAKSDCDAQIPYPISECKAANRCRKETSFAGKFPGIAVCHSGNAAEHSIAIPYFYSFSQYNSSTNSTIRYLNWKDAKPEDMLQLQSFPNPIYTNQRLLLVCNASYYFLGSGMYFDLMKEDTPGGDDIFEIKQIYDDLDYEKDELAGAKESIIEDEANVGGIGSRLPLVRSLTLRNFKFDAAGRYKLSCYAPVWNTSEWGTISTTVTVQQSLVPEFDGGNKTMTQYYAPYKRLECLAFGIPKPDLKWTRDGGTVPNEVSLTTGEQNQTLVWAILTFPKLPYGINGNFTCTASNVAGTIQKSIIIIPPDKNSSTAMWVLVGLALLVTILIPSILFLSWKVRTQRKYIEDLTQEEIDEFINGRPDYIPFQCDMSTYAYYLPYDTSYEIPRESLEIDLQRVLGSGEYGLVVYGLYKQPNSREGCAPSVKSVAIKTTRPLKSGKEYFKALLSELKIMTYIGSHKNIVNLIGACTQNIKKREVYIATEFCENDNLLVFLRKNRYAYENPCNYTEIMPSRLSAMSAETSFISPITNGVKDVQYVKMEDLGNIALNQQYENIQGIKPQDLLRWAYEIACGMEFLASKKVIHGDLAARNVLLTRDYTAKIGDFGLSKQLYHYSYYTKTAATPLPLKWLAIECLQSFQFSIESDVWAYGITLFELFTIGEMPYTSVQMNGEEFLRALKQGMRLSKPPHAPVEVFDLMMKCWKNDKKQRPSFKDIVTFFESIVQTDSKDKGLTERSPVHDYLQSKTDASSNLANNNGYACMTLVDGRGHPTAHDGS